MTNVRAKSYVAYHEETLRLLSARYPQFHKEHIEKALSATGYKKIEDVSHWLLSHYKSDDFNDPIEREFIAFLCPTGPLLEEISKFFELSLINCGINAAHNLFPHITLSSFFKVSDSVLPYVLDIFQSKMQQHYCKPAQDIQLHLQWSESYIGLFLDDQSISWLTEAMCFISKTAEIERGIYIKPHDRKFHLTLAYNFSQDHSSKLKSLAKKIDLRSSANWHLKIYSRESRFNGKQVHVVVEDYKATHPKELDLLVNNHVIMTSENHKYQPCSSWREGKSYETGKTGYFPESSTKKTAEWKIWSKNLSMTVFKNSTPQKTEVHQPIKMASRSQSFNAKKNRANHCQDNQNPTWSPIVLGATSSSKVNFLNSPFLSRKLTSQERSSENPIENSTLKKTIKMYDSNGTIKTAPAPEKDTFNSELRRIFVMRHAERVDLTFGHDWFNVYIDDKGYHRRNLNMPRRIPTRRGGPKDFFMDGPITEIGMFQAKLIGEAMRAKGISFSHVFSSPSLRSIQTAASVLDGMGDQQSKIKIEPALFEWMMWCKNNLPKFMANNELAEFGTKVDENYQPFFSLSQFNLHEKCDEYYYRSHAFVDHVVKNFSGNILMLGHSASLDVCTRILTGGSLRKTDDLIRVIQKVPFCGHVVIEQVSNKRWSLVQSSIPSLAHSQNQSFDWRVLQD
ncbi:ecdysteroid-phosphate phosphatase isoform X2 [Hydra vulgaris]|uniref:Ecdysteroid-phosphate phosphatase isoform X2 n=1 Tax=Hydra vulgaris TaxID=6087 RepID=A0ABM4B533_HYDVU